VRPVSSVTLPQLWPARCHRSFHSAIQMLPVLPRMSNTIFSRRMSKSGAVGHLDLQDASLRRKIRAEPLYIADHLHFVA
jgi:hypothetical protein